MRYTPNLSDCLPLSDGVCALLLLSMFVLCVVSPVSNYKSSYQINGNRTASSFNDSVV